MKTRITYCIAILFISLFLAKGITEYLYSSGYIVNKIVVTADAETEDQENGKDNFGKETVLFHEKPVNIIPFISNLSIKENISSRPAMWRNITLPVFTPPPEIA